MAELSGVVLDVYATVGLLVGSEQVLLVMESMKMEIPVLAGASGRVLEVPVSSGDRVRCGDLLAVVELAHGDVMRFPAGR